MFDVVVCEKKQNLNDEKNQKKQQPERKKRSGLIKAQQMRAKDTCTSVKATSPQHAATQRHWTASHFIQAYLNTNKLHPAISPA